MEESKKFDPQVQYAWKADDVFPLNGASLQYLHSTLAEKLNTPEAQSVLKDYNMFRIVEGILAQQVEEGKIIPRSELQTDEVNEANK